MGQGWSRPLVGAQSFPAQEGLASGGPGSTMGGAVRDIGAQSTQKAANRPPSSRLQT